MGPADGLPPNWEAFQTDDGEWYYYNSATEETTWDKPAPLKKKATPAPAAVASKPAA